MEHIISMTRQELQDQLDATSRLCERLTQAVQTLAGERDAARELLGDIRDGISRDGQVAWSAEELRAWYKAAGAALSPVEK